MIDRVNSTLESGVPLETVVADIEYMEDSKVFTLVSLTILFESNCVHIFFIYAKKKTQKFCHSFSILGSNVDFVFLPHFVKTKRKNQFIICYENFLRIQPFQGWKDLPNYAKNLHQLGLHLSLVVAPQIEVNYTTFQRAMEMVCTKCFIIDL